MAVTSAAAQGSILGPDVCNVAYDSLLGVKMRDEVCQVGYADDVTILIAARTVDLAHIKLNRVMQKICSWTEAHGLSLALNKTEVVVLAKKRILTIFPLRVGDVTVGTKPIPCPYNLVCGSTRS